MLEYLESRRQAEKPLNRAVGELLACSRRLSSPVGGGLQKRARELFPRGKCLPLQSDSD
jgi:hypothetical protein